MDSVRWSRSPPAKTLHFFKIILSDITPHSRLMIPRKFITECGYHLGHSVNLRAPAGSVWEVKVERSGGEVWLGHGWPEFAANYSICFGHFLVFRYEGNSHFHVIILDRSAAEIEYPLSTSCSEPIHIRRGYGPYGKTKELATANNHVGSMEEFANCCQSKDALSMPHHIPSKKKTIVSACVEVSHHVGLCERKMQETAKITSKKEMKSKVSVKSEGLHSDDDAQEDRGNKEEKTLTRVTSEAGKIRVHVSPKAFQSKTPFFTIKIQPSYVSGKFVLCVPKKIIDTCISKDSCNVSLQVSEGRAWSVRCCNFGGRARFGAGWKTFAQANNLAVGDVCVFQLINQSENLLNVVIYRNE